MEILIIMCTICTAVIMKKKMKKMSHNELVSVYAKDRFKDCIINKIKEKKIIIQWLHPIIVLLSNKNVN